ncbi:MAG: GNAT family N-acetyltransferase [Oscillospiraceae bacterium]|nr:GNAT family N-acetyltransferase [Oscillospiraceae bacterium]
MNYVIKQAEIEDLPEAIALVKEVFMEFEAPVYSEEGVEYFMQGLNYEQMREGLTQRQHKIWVCRDLDTAELIGVIRGRPPGHINLLFVAKKHHRKGIARALFNEYAKYCKADAITEITVNSSPYAVEAYRKLGFCETDSEQVTNGIRATPMKKIDLRGN